MLYIIRILAYIVTTNASLACEKTLYACMHRHLHVCMHVCVWVSFAGLLSCLFVFVRVPGPGTCKPDAAKALNLAVNTLDVVLTYTYCKP